MFARLFAVATLAALAVASPAPLSVRSQCNTGSLQCCNTVQSVKEVSHVLALFGLDGVIASATDQVGITCRPMTAVGTSSGADCQQQPVCCNGNALNGLLNINCTPVNLGA